MWISKWVKVWQAASKGKFSSTMKDFKEIFMQAMLYNAPLGRIKDISFQGREKSRKFISTRGEYYFRWGKTNF